MEFETVPSGSYSIKKNGHVQLRAFLGSCVGVAIVDEEARVAGLYHILLPEPPGKGAAQEPEKYASTGMALFLADLQKAGAKKERLKASVAGGSLVGNVSMIDLKLDIGGQSAEIVANFLKLENIPVIKMETGGYLSFQIALDTSKLVCKIEPIVAAHPAIHNPTPTINKKLDLDEAMNKVRPIPQIALRVIRMINEEDISLSTIAKEIRQDQILTAKVLQLSNSAYFNPRKPFDSIDRAIIFLGEKRILLMTLSVFTEIYYQQAEQGYSLVKGGLFRHALSVAFVAESIAKLLKSVAADQAYTGGLLHDFGKVVLDQFMAKEYPLFYRKMMGNTTYPLIDLEKEIFGYSHPEIGKILAEKWSLPENLQEVIAYHHNPEAAQVDAKLTNVIYLSNQLVNSFASGESVHSSASGDLGRVMEVLQVSPAMLSELIDALPWNEMDRLELGVR